ncbi:Cullin [Phycomyces blakesleeanus NRRL 1555(-)]|uniref:Cullin-5 n=2 Tax=Phycomyces blakesleeanus TaxID=4837 RepID=A0A162Y0Z5_PHYB8|nr:Cullin [Phycomyces blakesleeanus NRRL 1555(-)]OAD77735.1 Cullin [Phycomyces blakesleeanus NRRL 1555(-)]|eukprot:XP_018295775.1 Cullin [Phycomyces blakesleeanus NRRL 1555(-)]
MSLRRKPINFEKTFAELKDILDAIFSFSALGGVSGMNMFQLIYDMCNAIPQPFTEKVFTGIAEYIDKHTVELCQNILKHDDLVTAYARPFERFKLAAEDTSAGCNYLNGIITAAYSTGSRDRKPSVAGGKYKKQSVESLAMSLWKTNVLFTIRDRHQNRLLYQVFELIRRDRDGVDAPYGTIKGVVTSLVQAHSFTGQPLQLYIEEFERPYLVHTKRYYEAEAAREIASGSVSSFMKKASERLEQEIKRNNQYCHSTSHSRIVKEFEAQYITAYQDRIIDEFENMLRDERYEDCTRAYNLLSRIPDGLKPILTIYEEYISKIGKDMVSKLNSSALKNPRLYVDQLLILHGKFHQVNQQVFLADPLFTAAGDKAFRTIINDPNGATSSNGSETLARYCDMMLKKNAGKKEAGVTASTTNSLDGKKKGALKKPVQDIEDGDPEEKLAKMITLFKYVDDKDVFQKFYSRMLAKRLIYSASASEEMEANMINCLKEICGVEYTSKLNKMFTDMSLSSDLNVNFKDYLKQQSCKMNVGFDILVLTQGAWPLNQKEDPNEADINKVQIPSELEENVTLFEDFYGKHHNGRRLLWQWNLARGEMRLNYLDRHYELQVGLYQIVILLLFNSVTEMSIADLLVHSGLSLPDTLRSIKPLVDIHILESNASSLNKSSVVKINMKFSSKRTKIKVSAAGAQAEAQQESQATRKAVEEDRRMYIQAAVVRIMKSRQRLSHVQLIQEIIDQANSRFSPSVIMIKKCIEQLLEKQFIARQGRDTYVYVA